MFWEGGGEGGAQGRRTRGRYCLSGPRRLGWEERQQKTGGRFGVSLISAISKCAHPCCFVFDPHPRVRRWCGRRVSLWWRSWRTLLPAANGLWPAACPRWPPPSSALPSMPASGSAGPPAQRATQVGSLFFFFFFCCLVGWLVGCSGKPLTDGPAIQQTRRVVVANESPLSPTPSYSFLPLRKSIVDSPRDPSAALA